MTFESKGNPATMSSVTKKQENHKHQFSRDVMLDSELWTNGLICAFEFVRGNRKPLSSGSGLKADKLQKPVLKSQSTTQHFCKNNTTGSSLPTDLEDIAIDTADGQSQCQEPHLGCYHPRERNYWMPIGWERISELILTVQVDADWASQPIEIADEDDITVADVAAPYWERPVGPTWWCHVNAGHPFVSSWLSNAQWLHPAISIALRDESKLISERTKHLLYEVPVRAAGGLLFELLGQSVGDPVAEEDDIPVKFRFVHVSPKNVGTRPPPFLSENIQAKYSLHQYWDLMIKLDQELLAAGGSNIPRTSHEVIALLACRLARWDDRLFRKYIFGAADEVELKFMNR
ncbi:hypothetical protein Sango_2595600 [Sesamum angolense]|uniref:Uncharacterized protein n=1 Tax=Sesamum angolense TaxID=2727404 RepID=A0AAE1W5L9_9LAMI|nr:hypothetical protein Sango_2595600 [Sesamum angolense]